MRSPHVSANCLSEIPQICFFLHSMRDAPCAMRAPHTSRSFSRFALVLPPASACAGRLRRPDCALRATRTPTPITCADCTNECLYQFGFRSVQPFRRQRGICSLSGYARLCTHTRARTHTHTYSNKPILSTDR
jgi:hypothetical protein